MNYKIFICLVFCLIFSIESKTQKSTKGVAKSKNTKAAPKPKVSAKDKLKAVIK